MRNQSLFAFLASILVSLVVAGCTDINITQPVGEIIVRDGQKPTPTHSDDGKVAAEILPYALMADQTYRPSSYNGPAQLSAYHPLTACRPNCQEEEQQAEKILSSWRLIAAMEDKFGTPSGLAVQVWAKRGKACSEVVIAFRGTVPSKGGNWVSNLHWLVRVFGIADQYTQVRYNIKQLIDFAQAQPCYEKGHTTIAVVGHSLGGGLAQHAGYVDGRIDNVYVFDPSFVTGSWDGYFPMNPADPGLRNRKENVKGLTVKRVYEHGEILAYIRFFTRHINPPTRSNPHVVLIRFNVVEGNFFKQHKLIVLNTCLIAEANARTESERKARRILLKAVCADE